MSDFLAFPDRAAFLAECEQVRRRAVRTYADVDTPARIAARRRAAFVAFGDRPTPREHL